MGESSVSEEKDRRSEALGDLRFLPDEILCTILTNLMPRDVARLSCVSREGGYSQDVARICRYSSKNDFNMESETKDPLEKKRWLEVDAAVVTNVQVKCLEACCKMLLIFVKEPLWMSLCLSIVNQPLEYRGSWKKTTLHQLNLPCASDKACKRLLHFEGFNSLFLYRRLYRCYTSLKGFSFDDGNVERRQNLTLDEFSVEYDGKKPVLIDGLADSWPARKAWTSEGFLLRYPDTSFRLSQRSSRKICMKFKDYMSYMQIQHDEDPLYIFDDKFGEAAPDLLKDYNVPYLFQEDYFDVLDINQRPAFRWLIIGPERSGASWHVDPALTSAWNTLLCGRKRWALYPPGRVPLGVTVHVNEDDGDVNIETPSSLQWWLDFYPLLAEKDKPIECTQLPGETIYVPSGWWHCVLNLETTIAVTQNFVNSRNFEFVCLDMAPGYRHKGVCRAGLLALDDEGLVNIDKYFLCMENNSSCSNCTRKEKRHRVCESMKEDNKNGLHGICSSHCLCNLEYSYDINFLAMFLDKERDHYSSLWSSSNCIGQREMRDWLWKLWEGRPGIRDLIWKGACLALNADKWSERVGEICTFHGLPLPLPDERLPVGTGSNPVYLVSDYVIKIFVEGGLENSLYGLGTELEFYSLLHKLNSPLNNYVPALMESGILHFENGSYRLFPWDGSSIPEVISCRNLFSMDQDEADYPFGIWGKKQFEYKKARRPIYESTNSGESSFIWPYIVIKKCRGKLFAELRDILSSKDVLNLASFLGEQLRNLHLVPIPFPSATNLMRLSRECSIKLPYGSGFSEANADEINNPTEWKLFISILNCKRNDASRRLAEWGDPIPSKLIESVDEYIPHDFTAFVKHFQNAMEIGESCTWLHTDVMDDNIYMTPSFPASFSEGNACDSCVDESTIAKSSCCDDQKHSWSPSYILDLSDLSIGEPILDVIPIYLDVFRGDSFLLQQFLRSYGLPLLRKKNLKEPVLEERFSRLSYRAMCHCILHDENVLGAIFSQWEELRMANSWEEVEEKVWGDLNKYDIC